MKILILNKYQNKVSRGAETFVNHLADGLSKKHDVQVMSDINYLDLLNLDFDLVIPTNGRMQAILVRLITLLRRKKIIISGQSGIGFDDRLNLYCFPDVFVSLSDHACKWAGRVNPFVKVVNIPNGVDLYKFKESNGGRSSNKKNVLAVGAFTKEKGHLQTIKAVANLADVSLTIVGSGGEIKDEIESLGQKLLGSDRFFLKSVSHEMMPSIYIEADLFCFPTVSWESFGIAILEAMACGLPVIANNDPIRKEIVGDAGFFVDPDDIDQYSKLIRKALQINWGNRPRLQAEKFGWEKIVNEYEKLINNL